jgi:hypothetical protein
LKINGLKLSLAQLDQRRNLFLLEKLKQRRFTLSETMHFTWKKKEHADEEQKETVSFCPKTCRNSGHERMLGKLTLRHYWGLILIPINPHDGAKTRETWSLIVQLHPWGKKSKFKLQNQSQIWSQRWPLGQPPFQTLNPVFPFLFKTEGKKGRVTLTASVRGSHLICSLQFLLIRREVALQNQVQRPLYAFSSRVIRDKRFCLNL